MNPERIAELRVHAEAAEAMEITWANRDGIAQAIPPAYSKHIGKYALMALGAEPEAGT